MQQVQQVLGFAILCITALSMTACIIAGCLLNDRDRYKGISFKGSYDRRAR